MHNPSSIAANQALGVDVGGVIIERTTDDSDTSFFDDNYLASTAVEGAFEMLASLNNTVLPGQIHIVSKCGPRIQSRTMEWFVAHDFHGITGIEPDHVHFCLRRPQKAEIAEELGLTHFVDDRLDVLSHLDGIVANRYLLNGREDEIQGSPNWQQELAKIRVVHGWNELTQAIILGIDE